MGDRHEWELEVAIAEGILSRSEAVNVSDEARRRQLSPLALLVEQGRMSADTLTSLCSTLLAGRSNSTVSMSSSDASRLPPSPIRVGPPAFPVPGWDRYTGPRFLGQGGMGTVFVVLDPRLRREVALKFVRGDDPDHARRLISEARAQARVRHACVCEIHEVGEVDGKVYIAMQYIAGDSLAHLAGELTVEQKVMLVRGAALGLHEAHRVGIIHRDVKPSNILVERGERGELRPYVVDFGLARATHDEGLTLSGAIVGTPHYMAPEQAIRDAADIDRRADVYGLGATLYYLLTGQPPTPGTGLFETMGNLLCGELRPPRAIAPGVPIDLEAIVVKCLDSDRAGRYDSARALADDLGRFLDGAPVVARPVGAWYRLRKRLARHRRLVVAGAAALVALATLAGWALLTRAEANERERLARRFTESVERIEAIARYSALSPLHDVRPDRAALRARMAELDAEIRRAGAIALGPGHYALGRGYLALDDDEHARTELEAAWQAGYREPRVAYALGVTLGHLYQQALRAAGRIEDKDLRAARRAQAEHQYRDPALHYLSASRGAEVPSTDYEAALVAFDEHRFDDALHHLDAIGSALPWFYEAFALRGDVFLAKAISEIEQGQRDAAGRDLEAGRRAYAAAGAVGQSVPVIFESLGELEYKAMKLELYGGGDVAPPFQRVTAATGRALAIVPDDYDALVLEARAYRSLAEYRTNHGAEADDLIQKAIADAERAIAAFPARAQARLELAQDYRQWGEALETRSRDPSALLARAVAASEHIAPEDRDAEYYNVLSLIYHVWADYDDDAGRVDDHRTRAIDAGVRALQLDDKVNGVRINLGINYYRRAKQRHDANADADLQRAIRALAAARAVDPRHVLPYFYGGLVFHEIAQRDRARGASPERPLRDALELYRAGLVIDPKLPQLHNGLGLVLIDQATAAWDQGADPEPALAQAQAAFDQAILAAPEQGFAYGNLGYLHVQHARFQRARGEHPGAQVREAILASQAALHRIPDQSEFSEELGRAHSILAAYELDTAADPRSSADQATAALDTALTKNPANARALCTLGETRTTLAVFHARGGQASSAEFDAAVRAFEDAIAKDPSDLECQVALARALGLRARFLPEERDSGAAVQRGVALIDRVLARRPRWPDAEVVRASLLLDKAETATAAERTTAAKQAMESFDAALTRNRALTRVWSASAARASVLAAAR